MWILEKIERNDEEFKNASWIDGKNIGDAIVFIANFPRNSIGWCKLCSMDLLTVIGRKQASNKKQFENQWKRSIDNILEYSCPSKKKSVLDWLSQSSKMVRRWRITNFVRTSENIFRMNLGFSNQTYNSSFRSCSCRTICRTNHNQRWHSYSWKSFRKSSQCYCGCGRQRS